MFPNGYRTARSGAEAAADIVRFDSLSGVGARSVRIASENGRTRLKIYRQGGALSLVGRLRRERRSAVRAAWA